MPNQQSVNPAERTPQEAPLNPAEQSTSTRNNAGKIIAQDQAAVHVGNVYNYGSRSQVSTARPPPCRVIPFPRNEDVVDRPDLLHDLERLFLPGPDYQSAALWGLGGSGWVFPLSFLALPQTDEQKVKPRSPSNTHTADATTQPAPSSGYTPTTRPRLRKITRPLRRTWACRMP